MSLLLKVDELSTHFHLSRGTLKAVDRVSFTLDEGATLAIVGESGCGKSMTAYSIMRLVPAPGTIVGGEVRFEDVDLLSLPEEEMRRVRGNKISMVFQEPMTSLNPVFTVGRQIAEGLQLHRNMSAGEARAKTVALLAQVGIPSPDERYGDYPHQLSGGMRQRIMIAIALACRPKLLIADEPTTALDVTIQAQILELIDQLKKDTGMGLILITHDLGIVAERSETTVIMYAGRVVEQGPTADIFAAPLHPYTMGLLRSLPQNNDPSQPLMTIPGSVPDLLLGVPGCGFCDRCPDKTWSCRQDEPPLRELSAGHFVRCWKYL